MKVSVQLRFLCTTALGWAGELLSSFNPPFRFIYIYSLGISNKYRWMSERVSRSFLSSGLYTANISDVVSTNNCLLSTFKRFPLIRISYLVICHVQVIFFVVSKMYINISGMFSIKFTGPLISSMFFPVVSCLCKPEKVRKNNGKFLQIP